MSLLEQILDLLKKILAALTPPPKPEPEPDPQPQPQPEPQPQPTEKLPKGLITTRGPKGQNLGTWDNVTRWWPLLVDATRNQAGDLYKPLLLMCMMVIESGGKHYRDNAMTGRREDVIQGGGNPPSIGLMQVVCGYHAASLPAYDCYTPEGQIRLAARLMHGWIASQGSWEAAVMEKYHPGTDPNSGYTPQSYVDTVRKLIAEAKAVMEPPPEPQPEPQPQPGTQYAVAGADKKITLPFPLHVRLIPTAQVRQRPGNPMRPDRYVQHDTGNRSRGANALMHQRYLANGAEGQQLGYHFTVDDHEAYQMIPVNEITWHGGDGSGPCNFRGLSCELCVNSDIDVPKSRENAAILAAELMNALDIEALESHQSCAGKFCPASLLNETNGWSKWKARVRVLQRERA